MNQFPTTSHQENLKKQFMNSFLSPSFLEQLNQTMCSADYILSLYPWSFGGNVVSINLEHQGNTLILNIEFEDNHGYDLETTGSYSYKISKKFLLNGRNYDNNIKNNIDMKMSGNIYMYLQNLADKTGLLSMPHNDIITYLCHKYEYDEYDIDTYFEEQIYENSGNIIKKITQKMTQSQQTQLQVSNFIDSLISNNT